MAEEKKKSLNEAPENKETQKTLESKTESKPKTTKSSKKKSSGKKRIKITCDNAIGKYLLGYSDGDIAELEAKQADELIKAGDAREFTKEIEAKEHKEAKQKSADLKAAEDAKASKTTEDNK